MLQKYIDAQYRQPSGLVGRWIGSKMARQHRPETAWTVRLLDVQPTNHVLEVGFGPGIAVQAVARRASSGLVAGVDVSPTMVAAASRRNANAVFAGRVDLRQGDAAHLPFAGAGFDEDTASTASISGETRSPRSAKSRASSDRRASDSDGAAREKWNPANPEQAGTPECIPYSGDELKALLGKAGFAGALIEADARAEYPSNFSVLGRKPIA